ncbi:MAG: IS1634 family transposase [Acidimicrobiales bacterium]
MFVKTSTVRRDNKVYEYLSLVEAVRDGARTRHHTVLRLGEASVLRDTGQLERIIAALQRHVAGEWVHTDDMEATDARSVGAVAAVAAYWGRLGLGPHFGGGVEADAVFAMVANRLCDPCSKRRVPEWFADDVAAPDGFAHPPLHRYYRAVDVVAQTKEATESHLYARLTDLANLDLRLVCYDLTSTYFEGEVRHSERFASRAFGYSRDHRGDRPQIVIGLLTTGDGIPIAHHVFAGNTADVSTLPGVLADLSRRFAVGSIPVVADRGLISADNVQTLTDKGFDHVLATRLHRDPTCAAALEASARPDARWVPVPEAASAACEVTLDGKRAVVVASFERWVRDSTRTAELVAATSDKLRALEARVRAGSLADAAKIGRAAQRILGESGVGRLFEVEMSRGLFVWHYRDAALDYEKTLAGRYVLVTSLSPAAASTAHVVMAYRRLLEVEHRFRVLKDFLHLRPVFHWTEDRVRGHVAICVYAGVIEALMAADLSTADIRDPDLDDQHLSPARALRELARIRAVGLDAGDKRIELVTRRTSLQTKVLAAFGVDTTEWSRARIA